MRLSKKIVAFLIVPILGIMLVALASTAQSVSGFLVVIALVVVAGATQIFGSMFYNRATKLLGEAFFEDRPPEKFDADAAFERALRKREGQSSPDE